VVTVLDVARDVFLHWRHVDETIHGIAMLSVQAAAQARHARGGRMRVALMVTCVNDAMFPEVGQAVVRLLRRLGVEVDFPAAQTCCGQPMVNTGYLDEAVPVVRGFVDAFAGYDAIVAPSGSCVGSVRHQHSLVARRSGDAALVDGAARTSAVVHELSEFLVDVLGVEDVGAYFPHKVTYHPTCHSLRMLGVGDRPTRLLRAVRGLRLVDLPAADQCCGFGGTFAVKNPDTSVAMGADKARHVRDTGAEVLIAGDSSCLMHVGGILSRERAGVRVMHLAEVLAATETTEVSQLPESRDTTGAADGTRSPESTDSSRVPFRRQEQA
jgi:L-lactate dehydrogenase complex protein LldE